MMTLAVLGWQVTIILTLGLARWIGDIFNRPGAIYVVCGAWIIFTLVSLFFMPLIVVQLIVIIGATRIFAPSVPATVQTAAAGDGPVQKEPVATPSRDKNQAPKTLEDFQKCCDSPAEEAFLDIMVRHYALKPVDNCLMRRGITLELQFPIDKCRADFVINECLIVEIDGAAYHTSKEAIRRDTRRDKFIRHQGFHILRVPAKYPLYGPSAAINKVRRAISIVAVSEAKKNYAEEDRFFHAGAQNRGLRYKSRPSGLSEALKETSLRHS